MLKTVDLVALGFAAALSGVGAFMASGDLMSSTWVALAVTLFGSLFWKGRGWRESALSLSKTDPHEAGSPWAAAWGAFRESHVQTGKGPVRTASARDWFRRGASEAPEEVRPHAVLQTGQAMLVSIGLLGTFFGLGMGLLGALDDMLNPDPAVMQLGLAALLGGAKTAFSKSFTGVGLSVVWQVWWRAAEHEVDASLRHLAERLDKEVPFVTPTELLQRSIAELAAKQPDAKAFDKGAVALQHAAASLAGTGETLKSVSTKLDSSLQGFSAEAIGEHVAQAVRYIVDQQLAPVMGDIRTELVVLREMKREMDEAVRRQLGDLVEELRVRALTPITEEVKEVSRVVQGVSGHLTETRQAMEATRESVIQVARATKMLTGEMSTFQQQTLGRLGDFAGNLERIIHEFSTNTAADFDRIGQHIRAAVDESVRGLAEQRIAFKESATEAVTAFKGQSELLAETGRQASSVIDRAGNGIIASVEKTTDGAMKALRSVQEEFSGTLADQRGALSGVLDQLTAAYKREVEAREQMNQRLRDASAAVDRLNAEMKLVNSVMDGQTSAMLEQVSRAVADLAAAHGAFDTGTRAIQDWALKLAMEHERFQQEEDEHLAQVLEGLHRVATEISRAQGAQGGQGRPVHA